VSAIAEAGSSAQQDGPDAPMVAIIDQNHGTPLLAQLKTRLANSPREGTPPAAKDDPLTRNCVIGYAAITVVRLATNAARYQPLTQSRHGETKDLVVRPLATR